MSSRFFILITAGLLAASPLIATGLQDPTPEPARSLVTMYDYGKVYVTRAGGREGMRVGFGLELGPNQSWHFHAEGRLSRVLGATDEATWEPELLDDDGENFANAMLKDLRNHPEKLPNITLGLHTLGSYGWEVFQVDESRSSGGVHNTYHVRRAEVREALPKRER